MQRTEKSKGLRGAYGLPELPDDLQLTILGFMDVSTLLTARLVCKLFCTSATAHFRGLNLKCEELQDISTNNFLSPSKRLTVSISSRKGLHLLADSSIAPCITHIQLPSPCLCEEWTEVLDSLRHLPKLHSLSVRPMLEKPDFNIVQMIPFKLQELSLRCTIIDDASPLTLLSGLTHLGIYMRDASSAPSLASLTGLLSLRSLELRCSFTPSGVLTTLTMLTSLKVETKSWHDNGTMFPHLGRLSGLSHLAVPHACNVDIACLSHLTKLTSLNLFGCVLTFRVGGSSALAPLRDLVSLGWSSGPFGEVLLRHLRVERLQSLVLSGTLVDISVLQRATGLTSLIVNICEGKLEYPQELGPTLARMTRLRSLSLTLDGLSRSLQVFRLSPVLRALSCLTYLRYTGNFTVADDMQACASLPLLRRLELVGAREVTAACFPVLQGMSALTELWLWSKGIRKEDLTPGVREAFNATRLPLGWPPLKIVFDPFKKSYGIQ